MIIPRPHQAEMSKVQTQPPSSSNVSKPRYRIRHAGSMENSSNGERNHTPYTPNRLTMQGMHPHKLLTTICSRNAAGRSAWGGRYMKNSRNLQKVGLLSGHHHSITLSLFCWILYVVTSQVRRFQASFNILSSSFHLFQHVSTCFNFQVSFQTLSQSP